MLRLFTCRMGSVPAADVCHSSGDTACRHVVSFGPALYMDPLYSKPIPGKTPQEAIKAVDKMIVMGSKMDGAELKEAAMAHAKAIQNMDAKGVLTQADFEAINAGLGKAIASAGTAATMDVYNEMAKLAGSSPVPNYLFSKVNPQDAMAAYNGLLEFKDVVKAAQR